MTLAWSLFGRVSVFRISPSVNHRDTKELHSPLVQKIPSITFPWKIAPTGLLEIFIVTNIRFLGILVI